MTRYIRRAPRKPSAPEYPLLYEPRAFVEGDDARWRNVQVAGMKTITGQLFQVINRTRVHEMQQRKRTR